MTASRYARAASFANLEGALDVVRAAGSRVTSARRLLLEALFAAEGPVAADRLARSTGDDADAGDLASTYRNLELLEELGIVRHFHLGHGPGLYALAGPDEREYLVCERCGAVRRIDAAEVEPLRERIRGEYGFEVRFNHFPITGLCATCARSVEEGAGLDSGRRSAGGHGGAMTDHHDGEHEHERPHEHEHSHGDVVHSHSHSSHDHEHVEHEHEHSHGDVVHSHPHVHEKGLEEDHEHEHQAESGR
jgi:Fur family transcriptional regulator, ferric uptake regulator